MKIKISLIIIFLSLCLYSCINKSICNINEYKFDVINDNDSLIELNISNNNNFNKNLFIKKNNNIILGNNIDGENQGRYYELDSNLFITNVLWYNKNNLYFRYNPHTNDSEFYMQNIDIPSIQIPELIYNNMINDTFLFTIKSDSYPVMLTSVKFPKYSTIIDYNPNFILNTINIVVFLPNNTNKISILCNNPNGNLIKSFDNIEIPRVIIE